MEVRKIQSRRFSPYVEGNQKFCCKWSSDDRIAIVTPKEVLVHSFVHRLPEVDSKNYIRLSSPSMIYPPQEIPAEDDSDEFLKVKRQDYFKAPFPYLYETEIEIRNIYWSPKNLVNPNTCMLAVQTSNGGLELAAQVDKDWISVHNFTNHWKDIVTTSEVNDNESSNSERLFCTTSTWSCCYKDDEKSYYAYFISAYESSEIAVWKVKGVNSEDIGFDLNMDVQLEFKYAFQNTGIISALSWIEVDRDNYILFVGYYNGQIDCLKISQHKSEISMSICKTVLSDVYCGPVNSIQLLEQKENFIDVIVINDCILSTLRINTECNMISIKHMDFPCTITGACHVQSDLMLLTTLDCNISIVTNLRDQKEIIYTEIKSDLPKDGLQYLGLGQSQNKLIFSLICSPGLLHDGLSNKEPSSLYFFNLFDAVQEDPLLTLLRKPNLQDNWDFLELIKVNILKNNDYSLNLKKLISNLEKLSFYECRVAYWILSFILVSKKKSDKEEYVHLREQIETAKSYILSYSASERLKYLSLREKLNDEQKMSVYLLQCHLNVWLAGEDKESGDKESEMPLLVLAKDALKATNQFEDVQQENCDKCNVPILEPWAQKCSSGHFLERCPMTGLQVHEDQYRLCSICQELYHPCLDAEIDEMKCLYCDLPVIYDANLPFETLRTSRKNLSRSRKTDASKDNDFPMSEDINE